MMTDFGKWLGESNGQNMIGAIGCQNVTKEQFRSAITTYCILFGVEVDTNKWDELLKYEYEFYNSWFNDFNEFDLYMSELLV